MERKKAGLGAATACIAAATLIWSLAPSRAACLNCMSAVLSNEAVYSALAANQGSFDITGVVQGVSYAENIVEVQANGAKESIHITPTTTIDKHGQTGSIADIRPGVHITVTGVMRDGERVALTIQIK